MNAFLLWLSFSFTLNTHLDCGVDCIRRGLIFVISSRKKRRRNCSSYSKSEFVILFLFCNEMIELHRLCFYSGKRSFNNRSVARRESWREARAYLLLKILKTAVMMMMIMEKTVSVNCRVVRMLALVIKLKLLSYLILLERHWFYSCSFGLFLLGCWSFWVATYLLAHEFKFSYYLVFLSFYIW